MVNHLVNQTVNHSIDQSLHHSVIWFSFLQAMRLLMHPNNAQAAVESLAHMVDEIWYHAGDTTTDVSNALVFHSISISTFYQSFPYTFQQYSYNQLDRTTIINKLTNKYRTKK